jgi:hypothetical protein
MKSKFATTQPPEHLRADTAAWFASVHCTHVIRHIAPAAMNGSATKE